MNYQSVLKLAYVINLIGSLVSNPSFEIINIDDTYYIKDVNKNLYIITENNMKNYRDVEIILKTCIHFEKYKDHPIDSFINIHQAALQDRGPGFFERYLNPELLKALQSQYLINKTYFDL